MDHSPEHGHEAHGDHPALGTYFAIFFALMVGTALTVAAAFVDLGVLNTPVALLIAISKTVLVVLFFMHVRYNEPLVKVFVGAGFFWLLILLAFLFSDYLTRDWVPDPKTWIL